MIKPIVSVIVPVYNGAEFIENCYSMLENQTLKDIEMIFVDDGSTDGGYEKCDEIAKQDSRCIVIHQENRGVSAARNHGMKVAKGDYIGFVDVDDKYAPDMFETLYNLAKKCNADIACLDQIGKKDEVTMFTEKELTLKSFLLSNGISMSSVSKLFTRDLCMKVCFEEGRKIYEDFYFIFELLNEASVVVNQNTEKYYYIHREGSSSRTVFSEKYFDAIYFVDKVATIINSKYPSLVDCAEARKMNTYLRIIKIYHMRGGNHRFSDEIRYIKKYLYSISKDMRTKYYQPTNQIRYTLYRYFRPLFILMLKVVDKN